MEELVGQTIEKVLISDDQEQLAFVITSGEIFLYETDADCCSESWFNSVSGIDRIIGHPITKVTTHLLYDQEGTRQESDEVHTYTLQTDIGSCDVEFRNSSNGYYTGSCYSVSGLSKEDLNKVLDGMHEVKE